MTSLIENEQFERQENLHMVKTCIHSSFDDDGGNYCPMLNEWCNSDQCEYYSNKNDPNLNRKGWYKMKVYDIAQINKNHPGKKPRWIDTRDIESEAFSFADKCNKYNNVPEIKYVVIPWNKEDDPRRDTYFQDGAFEGGRIGFPF